MSRFYQHTDQKKIEPSFLMCVNKYYIKMHYFFSTKKFVFFSLNLYGIYKQICYFNKTPFINRGIHLIIHNL